MAKKRRNQGKSRKAWKVKIQEEETENGTTTLHPVHQEVKKLSY